MNSTQTNMVRRGSSTPLKVALLLFVFSTFAVIIGRDSLPERPGLVLVALNLGSILFAFFYVLIATFRGRRVVPRSMARVIAAIKDEREARLRELSTLKGTAPAANSTRSSLIERILWIHCASAFFHYRLQVKLYSTVPEFSAVCANSAIVLMYLLSVYSGLGAMSLVSFQLGKFLVYVVGMFVFALNYLYLMKRIGFGRIINEFGRLSENTLSRYRLIVVIYSLAPFVLFGVSLWILGTKQ